jgi:hypothetical protein
MRERIKKRRGKRERAKGRKEMSDELREGAMSTPSPTVETTYVKKKPGMKKNISYK